MSYRAMYAYPWDIADEGVSNVSGCVEALGLNTITIAGSYHAGKFLRPHGSNGKVYFPEDGTIYFNSDPSAYGSIKPVVSRITRERDVLRELTTNRRLAANVWLVLLHNTRLGEAHPESTVRNAFGDRYVYSLCPSAPDARAFAIALCRDVSEHYPIAGITLETPGFLPYSHGFHHEFAMVKLNKWIESLLGLCFCDHCVGSAEASGIDANGLQTRVRDDVDAYLRDAGDFPDDMAEAFWLSDVATDQALTKFLNWRCGVVTSLVREIRGAVRADATVAVIPSVARPTAGAWYEGSDVRALANAAGIVEASFYEPSAARVHREVVDTQRRLRGAGALRGILRPGYPDLQSRGELVAAATALRDRGVSGIAFYNYGHVRQSNLAWIADAVGVFGG
jgi:hypothetical protein